MPGRSTVNKKIRSVAVAVALSAVAVGAIGISWWTGKLALSIVRSASESRFSSPEYRQGLEDVRSQIPEDSDYLLLALRHDRQVVLLQGDLAPRRAHLAGRDQLRKWQMSGKSLPTKAVVYRGTHQTLTVVDTAELDIP